MKVACFRCRFFKITCIISKLFSLISFSKTFSYSLFLLKLKIHTRFNKIVHTIYSKKCLEIVCSTCNQTTYIDTLLSNNYINIFSLCLSIFLKILKILKKYAAMYFFKYGRPLSMAGRVIVPSWIYISLCLILKKRKNNNNNLSAPSLPWKTVISSIFIFIFMCLK